MVDDKLVAEIKTALNREPGVLAAYVLGSVVKDSDRPDSDFDLAVVVDNKQKISPDKIYELLFPVKFPRNLDLSIIDRRSSPLFLYQIISTGKKVYEKSPRNTVDFEAFVMDNYYDTAHLREIYASYLPRKFAVNYAR